MPALLGTTLAGMDVTKGVTPDQQFVKIMYDELVELMGSEQQTLQQANKPPTVILLAGLQVRRYLFY